MLRWLRNEPTAGLQWPRGAALAHRAATLVLLLALVAGMLPAPALAQQPQPQSAPQTLNFVNGVATVQSATTLNQNLAYRFFGSPGMNVQIQLTSQPTGANFEVRGVTNNTTYKSLADLNTTWSFTVVDAQNYQITVVAQAPVIFNLVVTINGGGPVGPQRITFTPGQNTATVTGNAGPLQAPQFVFAATSGQSVRILLTSPGTQANFTVNGVSDGVFYKTAGDQSRDWTFTLPTTQDYLITVTSPTVLGFTLQVTLTGAQPAERINFVPGQSTAVVSGSLQPNQQRVYVFFAAAGQSVRILLTAQPGGSANFSLVGAQNAVVYKGLNDPLREWQFTAPVSQDYLLTVAASAFTNYTLEVTIPTPLLPTLSPTPFPTFPAGCTADAIQNGGFETNSFWIFGQTAVPPAYTSTTVRNGQRAVRLGIDPALGSAVQHAETFSSMRQPFTLPAAANVAQLRWWHLDRSEEGASNDPGPGQDKQEVVLLSARDLSTVAVLYNQRQNTGQWQESLVDLTPYIGQSLVLYFNVFNDGNGQRTWQFVDDVIVAVCYPPVTPTPFVPPTATPQVLPTAVPPTIAAPTATPVPPTAAPPTVPPTAAVPGEPTVVQLDPSMLTAQAEFAALQAQLTLQPQLTLQAALTAEAAGVGQATVAPGNAPQANQNAGNGQEAAWQQRSVQGDVAWLVAMCAVPVVILLLVSLYYAFGRRP